MNVKEIRELLGLSQQKFGDYFGVPLRTIQRWEYGKSIPPKYTIDMMFRILQLEGKIDEQGNKVQTLSK